jgi:hypothetical protein
LIDAIAQPLDINVNSVSHGATNSHWTIPSLSPNNKPSINRINSI